MSSTVIGPKMGLVGSSRVIGAFDLLKRARFNVNPSAVALAIAFCKIAINDLSVANRQPTVFRRFGENANLMRQRLYFARIGVWILPQIVQSVYQFLPMGQFSFSV